MSESPRPPLDYRGPPTPGGGRAGGNFALGLLAGAAASGAGAGVMYAAARVDVTVATLVVLLVGKVGLAVSMSRSGRHPGFAPGVLVSFGVALLIYGGLCFAALASH